MGWFFKLVEEQYLKEMKVPMDWGQVGQTDIFNYIYREFEVWLHHRLKRIERIKIKRLDGKTMNMSATQIENYIEFIETTIDEINEYANNYKQPEGIERGGFGYHPDDKWLKILNAVHREEEGKFEIRNMKRYLKFLKKQEQYFN